MGKIRLVVTKVESCLVLPASVNLKRGDCRKLYCRGGSIDRSSFVGVWVAETNGVKTVLGFMGKSQLKESERSQVEAQSEVNQFSIFNFVYFSAKHL